MRKPQAAATSLGLIVLGLTLLGCSRPQAPDRDTETDSAAIESALRQWSHDFTARNLPAVCGLFADDAVLAYPGAPDRDRKAFCNQIGALFADPAKHYSYAEPEISGILVDGDLAVVRLVWTLTTSDVSDAVVDTSREDGLDVFRRQPDGTWKIYVSHAFPR